MLSLPDSVGRVFRPGPWCGQRDSSVSAHVEVHCLNHLRTRPPGLHSRCNRLIFRMSKLVRFTDKPLNEAHKEETLNQRVPGSSPGAPTKNIKHLQDQRRARSSQNGPLGRSWEDAATQPGLPRSRSDAMSEKKNEENWYTVHGVPTSVAECSDVFRFIQDVAWYPRGGECVRHVAL